MSTAAVIGTGFIGGVHVETLRRIGVRVAGVLGSSPERAAAKAGALGVDHVYPDLDALCADDAVDVVHVTSPNHAHAAQVLALIAAGKHVVCEKPLALTRGGNAEGFAETFPGLFEQVYADVAAGAPDPKPPYPTFADGCAGLAVEQAVLDSHRSGTWARVPSEEDV